MEWIKASINDYVKVKLTAHGINILHDYYNELFRGNEKLLATIPPQDKQDENGYTTFLLWDLMCIFGPGLSPGAPIPFDTEIEIQRKTEDV